MQNDKPFSVFLAHVHLAHVLANETQTQQYRLWFNKVEVVLCLLCKIQPLSVTNNKEVVIVSIQPLKTPAVQNVTSLFSTMLRFDQASVHTDFI